MKRILTLTLLAFAAPLVPGPAAVGQTATIPLAACPSDAPIAPPMGDVDQFVAFGPDGCPVPATVGITAVPSADGRVTPPPAPPSLVEQPTPAPVTGPEGADPRPAAVVTIPVEDGFFVTTGEAEAEAAARPKPADYSQRLDADYCAAVPWKCDAEADSFSG